MMFEGLSTNCSTLTIGAGHLMGSQASQPGMMGKLIGPKPTVVLRRFGLLKTSVRTPQQVNSRQAYSNRKRNNVASSTYLNALCGTGLDPSACSMLHSGVVPTMKLIELVR